MGGLLCGVDLDRLQAKLRREPCAGLFAKVIADFRKVSAAMKARNDQFLVGNCASYNVTTQEVEAAFIHRMTGDAEALDHVHRMIDALGRVWVTSPPNWHIRGGGRNTSYFSQALTCLAADLCRESLDPRRHDALRRMVRDFFIRDDGFERSFQFDSGHNIPLTRAIAAGTCALVYGQESGHPEWESYVDFARDACQQYCRWGLDEAGFSYEGVGYGYQTSIYWIFIYAQLLLQNGRDNLFASLPVLGRIPDATFAILFPDHSGLAQISDLWVPENLPFLCLTARHYDRPEDMDLWRRYKAGWKTFDSQGYPFGEWHTMRGGLLPLLWMDDAIVPRPIEAVGLPTASYAPGTETANFRTSWDRDAIYANLLGQGRSLASLGHMHADAGHYSIFAHGDYLAVDTGYWNELEDQHNVMLVDGKVSRHDRVPAQTAFRHGRMLSFQRDRLLDYVLVDQSAVKDCRWAHRHFMFVRLGGDDAYIVIVDDINPDDSYHSFWWQLHAHPQSRIALTGAATATIARERARLDCTFIIPSARDFPTRPHALALRADEAWAPGLDAARHAKVKADALQISGNDLGESSRWRPRLIAELTGLNGVMMTVIVPRRAAAAAIPVRPVEEHRVLRAEIDCGDFTDTIVSGPGHGRLRLNDLEGRTELALLRRDKAGRVIGQWSVEGGPVRFTKL